MPRRGNDGKSLEALVEYIETNLLPPGLVVTKNRKQLNGNKVNIAEFDLEIRGKLGGGTISWLIECRDRPATGRQGAAWIQQVAGKRDLHDFDRATAVSTTGFTPGAIEASEKLNIELREVKTLKPDEFKDWIRLKSLKVRRELSHAVSTVFKVSKIISDDQKSALKKLLGSMKSDDPVLRAVKSGELHTSTVALGALNRPFAEIFDKMKPSDEPVKAHLVLEHKDEDGYEIDTEAGAVRVEGILYNLLLSVKEDEALPIPPQGYKNLTNGTEISKVAAFNAIEVHGMMMSLEFHKLEHSGETSVVLRNHGAVKVPAAPAAR